MKKLLIILFVSLLLINELIAQPKISYILPDIGAPGMNVYVEFIGPTDKLNNFGTKDTIYLNNPGDFVRVFVDDPTKSDKVVVGPVVVSWGGRMISTQIFIKETNKPTENEALKAGNEFRIPLTVEVNGVKSNTETFYIVKPYPYHNGIIANPTDNVFGEGSLGKRSPRGAIIFDSLKLAPRKYTVSLADCDPSTTYNEAFLPFVLLSKGNIEGTIGGTNRTIIDVSADRKTAGPGGGGGGGAYCDVLIGGSLGNNGGDGFTGGGPGGENFALGGGRKKNYGNSTGPNLSGTNDYGGYSLNGVPGPFNATVNFEAAGGGTGHPFGISGKGTLAGSSDNPEGQFGGGSGRTQNQKGGSGGFATDGAGLNISYGKSHGNPQCIPLAGGSGAASGNPMDFLPPYCSGDGGGGGGAIMAFAKNISAVTFYSYGGKGGDGNSASDGGDGSGGMIIASSKGNVIDVYLDSRSSVSSTTGTGYARIESIYADKSAVLNPDVYSAISTDTTNIVPRNFKIIGSPISKNYKYFGTDKTTNKIHFYLKSESGIWQEISKTMTPLTGSSWSIDMNLIGTDKYHYFVAVQEINNPSSTDYKKEPAFAMSQAGANIFRLDLHPIVDTARTVFSIRNDSLNCGSNTERNLFIDVYNHKDAEVDLEIISAKIENYDPTNFKIILPSQPIKPNDKGVITVVYTYQGNETSDFWCNLRVKTNDPIAKPIKYRADSTFSVILDMKKVEVPNLEIVSSVPANLKFDDTRTGQTSNMEITYKNTGSSKLLIDNIPNVFPPNFFVIQKPAVPLILNPNQEFKITLQFKPTNQGTISGKVSIASIYSDTTCSFNIESIVSGIAIQSSVEVTKFEMDFGNIPWCKIVNDSVRILNPTSSSVPFDVTEPAFIEGVDKDVFVITSNILKIPMNLTPGDGVMIKVRFDPSLNKSKEDFSAELVIKTNEPSTPEIRIALKGKTAHFKMAAIPSAIVINNAIIGFDSTYTFEILNNGLLPEYLRTNNPIEFSGSFIKNILSSPNLVNPTEKRSISFRINPSQNLQNDMLNIIFDTPCNDTIKVPITVNALSTVYDLNVHGNYNLINDEVDFGKFSPCETDIPTKTFSNMYWKNNGNAPFIVLNEELTDLGGGLFVTQPSTGLINDTIYTVNSSRIGLNFNVQINANTPNGTYYANYKATIYINGKIEVREIKLKVTIEKGKFLFSENSLSIQEILNSTKNGNFTFTNQGPWNLIITNVSGPSLPNFKITPNVSGKSYNFNEGDNFTVSFTPTEAKDYRDSIVFNLIFGNCVETYTLYLEGKGLPSKTIILSMPDLVTTPDLDKFVIPIFASLEISSDEISNFKIDSLEISFDRTLFFPSKVSNGKIIGNYLKNDRRHIIIEMDNINFKGENHKLLEITGYTMLGDTTKTELKFEKIVHSQLNLVSYINSEDGTLQIAICKEGDDRLLKYSNSPTSIDISPNPAQNESIAKLFLLEAGDYSIEISDLSGVILNRIELIRKIGESNLIEIPINLNHLSSGVYSLNLITPSGNIRKLFSVVK